MRRSEWRMRADDPKTLLGWWWRGVAKKQSLPLSLLPFFVCYFVGRAGGGWGWLLLATANLVYVVTRQSKDPWQELRTVLPDPAPKAQFKEQVTYRRNGLVTGRDDMALAIVDGWLIGEGVRSMFALRRMDVRFGEQFEKGSRLTLSDGSSIELPNVIQAGWTFLADWGNEPVPVGEPTLPPPQVHPQEIARSVAWLIVAHVLFAGLFLSLVQLPKGPHKAIVGLIIASGGITVLRRLWTQYSKLSEMNGRLSDSQAGQAPPRQGAAERTIGESRAEVRNSLAE